MTSGNYTDGCLYIRVSTGKQEELSPDAQKRLGIDWAKKNKIIVRPEHIFIEKGISGREAKKRPEFQRMIGMAKSKPSPFKVILVWKFSRFARNQEESIVYKSLLKKQCGVDVVSVSEPLVDGPFGSLIERIIEWMDEYYSIRLAGEVTRGMTENALRGGYQTTPCLGYDAVGKGQPFVINEEGFKSVEFIFHSASNKHLHPTEIARQLNDMGLQTRRGGLFEKRNVVYVLKNRFYIGKVIWDGIEREGSHETRISPEVFNEAQKFLDSLFSPIKRRNIGSCRHWLSGLLKCSVCGASLAYNSQGKGGTQYFNCWRYAKGFHRGSCSISVKKSEKAVVEYFERILAGEYFTFSYRHITDDKTLEIEEYKKELERVGSRELRVKLAYENGIDTIEEYKENKARIQADRERIENLITGCNTPEVQIPEKEVVLEKVRTALDVIQNDKLDYEVKGNLIRTIVEEIIFDRKTETFTFRLYTSD